jgi:hypothetical protein
MRRDNISPEDARRMKRMFRHGWIKLNLIRSTAAITEWSSPRMRRWKGL